MIASLGEGQGASDFLKKDKFMLGLYEPLWEKVRGKFLASYEAVVEIARQKKKKLFLHNNLDGSFMDHEGCPQHYPEEPRQPRPEPPRQGATIM